MQRKRSLGRRAALGCGGLIVLLILLALAAYGILHFVGGRRAQRALAPLKASGAPTTWEEVIPPRVPDDQNAALLYEEAFAAFALSDWSRGTLRDYLSAGTRGERKPLEKAVRSIIADNAHALLYARQAADRPKCRFNRNWSDLAWHIQVPELSSLKTIAQLASAEAVLRADEGDLPRALDAWSLNVSIADHLESDPMLLGQLTRYAVIAWAAASLPVVLQDSGLSPQQCRSLAEPLARIELRQSFIKSLEAQRASNLRMLHWVRQDPQNLRALVHSGSSTPPGRIAAAKRDLLWVGARVVGPFDDVATLQSWDEQIALAHKPYRETVGQAHTVRDNIPRYAILTMMYGPYYHRAAMARDRAGAYVAMMRTGLALAAYRTEFGRYPDTLDRLRKALEWEVPEDPFSGDDSVYRREGTGYVLYSLGQDLDDDGGKRVGGNPKDALDGDIVWRQAR